MKQYRSMLMDILKGMVVGIANIIPGVSGGTMMVSMGIYDKLIYSITHLFSDWKNIWRFLLWIGVGIVIAVVILSKAFEFFLENWPIATNLAFCGLIAGSLPSILNQVRHKGFNLADLLCFAGLFIFILVMALLSAEQARQTVILLNIPGIIMLFAVGVISAATMVIPGVSGSMILMLLGYYQPILSVISLAIDSLIHFNLPDLLYCIGVMIPFGLGIVVGIFAIAKLIEWIFDRWRIPAWWGIIGLIAASPLAILIKTDWALFSWIQLIIGIVLFALGFYCARLLASLE